MTSNGVPEEAEAWRSNREATAEPAWALPYLEDAVVAPGSSAGEVLAAARQLAEKYPVSGVLTWAEDHVLHAALVAEELGLPSDERVLPPVMGRSNEGKPGTRKTRYGKVQKKFGSGSRR